MERRRFLRNSLMASAGLLPSFAGIVPKNLNPKKKFRIGACDWSIGKFSDIGAFQLAKQIGVDGIMVDVGSEENKLHIREKAVQQAYLKESARTGIAISSLALGIFNKVPFHADPRTEEWLMGSIEAAKALNTKVLLLAFFSASDLRNDQKRQEAAITIIRKMAPEAERQGVVLGIESYLNAENHIRILDAVSSDAVKVYYDFRNTADAGYDTVAEFVKLGRDRICELHMKENSHLLGNGSIDWQRVAAAIEETGYVGHGWMQIEGAVPENGDTVASYRQNLAFLRKLFPQ